MVFLYKYPALGKLLLLSALTIPASAETASVTLPIPHPAEITTVCDPRNAAADLHRNVVSDTHVVASHAEMPIRICSENSICRNTAHDETYTCGLEIFEMFPVVMRPDSLLTKVTFEEFEEFDMETLQCSPLHSASHMQ